MGCRVEMLNHFICIMAQVSLVKDDSIDSFGVSYLNALSSKTQKNQSYIDIQKLYINSELQR